MTFFRSVTASILLVLFISAGSLTAAGMGSSGSTEGTFVGIERGNPAHFVFKEKGDQHSFVIPQSPDDSVKPYLDHPEKFKGRPVKVYWRKRFIGDGFMTNVVKVEPGKAGG